MKIMLFLLAACGGNPKANPCATKGASYVQRFTTTAGDCGSLPDVVVNITADGEIAGAMAGACEEQELDGCTVRSTNCKSTTGGVTCTATGVFTFAANGATASGTTSISCSGAAACAGSYSIAATRQ